MTRPVFTFSADNCGAIASITYNSVEILSVNTKADTACQRWEIGTDYILSEAGADAQLPSDPSVSRFVSSEFAGNYGVIKSYPAYTTAFDDGAEILEASGNLFTKRVTADFLGNDNILEIDSTLEFYSTASSKHVGWVHQVCLDEDLHDAYLFRVGDGGSTIGVPAYLGLPETTVVQLDTNLMGGLILTSADRSLACGIYHHGPTRDGYRIVTDLEYLNTPNRILVSSTEHSSVGEGANGQLRKKRYLCVGTYIEVVQAFIQLYCHFAGVTVTNGGGVATALQARITDPLNSSIGIGSPVDFAVTTINAFGGVDTSYGAAITATLSSGTGTLSGTLSESPVLGVATFDNLSVDTAGTKTIKFASGVLPPAFVSFDIDYALPVLTSITPTTGVENGADTVIHVFGSDFSSPSYVLWGDIGFVPSPVDTTFVSPGELQFTATTAMQGLGQHTVEVFTPPPGGGQTLPQIYTATARPTILSPHYISLDVIPTAMYLNQAETFVLSFRHSPSGQIAVNANGRIHFYSSPSQAGAYTGSISTYGSPVNGVVTVTGSLSDAGYYDFNATHSPTSGGVARSAVTGSFIPVYNPDPQLFAVSPDTVSPNNNTATIRLYGANFFSPDTSAYFSADGGTNYYRRTSTLVNANTLSVSLQAGDLATPTAATRYRYLKVDTLYSSSGVPTSPVAILVSPNPVAPPALYSPVYLTISTSLANRLVDAAVPVTVAVRHDASHIASFANGIIRLHASPVGSYSGSGTNYGTPTNSNLSSTVAVNSYGSYVIVATYSPAGGEAAVTSATSGAFSVVKTPPTLSSVSPGTYSPAGSLVVTLKGSGFSPSNMIWYYKPQGALPQGSQTYVYKSPTVASSAAITFNLSPNDFLALGTAHVLVTGAPVPFASGTSAWRPFTLAPHNVNSPEFLSFYPNLLNKVTPAPLNSDFRVGVAPTTPVTVYAYGTWDQVCTTATGNIVLHASPTNAAYTGTYTARAAISSGQATFYPTIADRGQYKWTATHSPSGSFTMAAASPLTNWVLNLAPTVSSISPQKIAPTTQAVTLKVSGTNFAANSDSTVYLDNGARTTTRVSSSELSAALIAADTTATTATVSHSISVQTRYAAAGGQTLTTYAPLPFQVSPTVVAPPITDEELLPATIEVSPLGYRRVLPTASAWTAVAAPVTNSSGVNPGSNALYLALLNTACKIPAGVIQPSPNGPGCMDIVDVAAGMYAPFWIDATGTSGTVKINGLGTTQPLIIRAKKKTDGTAYPVVIQSKGRLSGSDDTLKYTNNISTTVGWGPHYIHWYDIKIRSAGRSGMFLTDAANVGPNGEDRFYKDMYFNRCAVLGDFDYRMIQLAPYRFIKSIHSNVDASSQTQWNHLGSVLTAPVTSSPKNSFLWDLSIKTSEIHRAIERGTYCVSVRVNDQVGIPVVMHTAASSTYVAPTAGIGAGLLDIGYNSSPSTASSSVYYVELVAQTDGKDGGSTNAFSNIEEYNSGAWNNISIQRVSGSTVVPAGTVLPLVAMANNQWPLAGKVVCGTAVYPNLRFKAAGVYHFKAALKTGTLTSDQWPAASGSFIKDVYVRVTTPGVSQPESSLAKPCEIPKLKLINNLTSVFTLPVYVYLQAHTAEAANDRTQAPMVNGELTYTIDPANYSVGWRWAKLDGTTISGDTLTGYMINGFGSVYDYLTDSTKAQGIRLKWTGTGTGTGPIGVTIRPTDYATFPALGDMTFHTTSVRYTLELQSTSTAPLDLSAATASDLKWMSVDGEGSKGDGRVFASGWPGNPSHPNYDPNTTGIWYPNPAECPYLTYTTGIRTKWLMQTYSMEQFTWVNGFAGHSCDEHAFYSHGARNLTFKNSRFQYTGRTAIQVHNRRTENTPLPSTAPSANQIMNGPNLGCTIIIDGNYFADNGLNDGTVSVSLAEFAGDMYVKNNTFMVGYNYDLIHSANLGTGALIAYSGTFWKPMDSNAAIEGMCYFHPFMMLADGSAAIDFVDVNTYLASVPTSNPWGGLTSATHPAYYIWNLLNREQHLKFADGTVYKWNKTTQTGGQTAPIYNFDYDGTHPYYNRAYGHPLWSTAGKTDTLTVLRGATPITFGGNTTYYGGLQQLGNLYIEDNLCQVNSWKVGATAPASWVVPGIMPAGMYTLTKNGNDYALATGGGAGNHGTLELSGARTLVLNRNTVIGAAKPAIDINTKYSDDAQWTSAPCLNVTGYGNTISGGFKYFDLFTTSGGNAFSQAKVQALKNRLVNSTPPGPTDLF